MDMIQGDPFIRTCAHAALARALGPSGRDGRAVRTAGGKPLWATLCAASHPANTAQSQPKRASSYSLPQPGPQERQLRRFTSIRW